MNKEELLNDIDYQSSIDSYLYDQVQDPLRSSIYNILDPTLRCDLEYLLKFKVEKNIMEHVYNTIVNKC